jgi:hypothetical protein
VRAQSTSLWEDAAGPRDNYYTTSLGKIMNRAPRFKVPLEALERL